MGRAAQTFWRLAGPVVPFLLSPRNAKDTSESVRGDAGVQSTVGVTQAPAPPECGASPHASPPGRGTQRPQGSSQSSLSGSHRHVQLSAGVIRSHCHCRPPLPWFPGLFGAERPWTVSVGVQHGGFVTESGCYLRHSGPPGGDPWAQDFRNFREKGLWHFQEHDHCPRRVGSVCEAVQLCGTRAGKQNSISQKVIKDHHWLWSGRLLFTTQHKGNFTEFQECPM